MATKSKSTPSLPASSRMQMPSGGGSSMKGSGSMAGKKGKATNKVMAMASKGKSMSKKAC
jgi:hypothetical protein